MQTNFAGALPALAWAHIRGRRTLWLCVPLASRNTPRAAQRQSSFRNAYASELVWLNIRCMGVGTTSARCSWNRAFPTKSSRNSQGMQIPRLLGESTSTAQMPRTAKRWRGSAPGSWASRALRTEPCRLSERVRRYFLRCVIWYIVKDATRPAARMPRRGSTARGHAHRFVFDVAPTQDYYASSSCSESLWRLTSRDSPPKPVSFTAGIRLSRSFGDGRVKGPPVRG